MTMAMQGGRDVGPRPKASDDMTPENLFAFARYIMKFEELVALIAAFYDVEVVTIVKDGIKPKGQRGRAREMVCFFAYRLWAAPKGSPGSFNWIRLKMRYADKTGPYRAYRRIEGRALDDIQLREEIETIEQRLISYLRSRMEKDQFYATSDGAVA